MVLKKAGVLLSIVLLGSCSLLEPGLSVLQGNYAFQQGDYQKALLHFLDQQDQDGHKERIEYNIADVYYALGEGDSALEQWTKTGQTTDEDVLFASRFNSGVVLYQNGRFAEAYKAFRAALELKSTSLEAKKNLELALERMENEARSSDTRGTAASPEASEDVRRIMQYIKRKEGSQWSQQADSEPADQDW